ncbi:MAG TPA: hypothetical protein VJA22_02600, partial [Patescibacteria group bacterium]|nr:hypothetical protein [Patescibacteria group bacterium]
MSKGSTIKDYYVHCKTCSQATVAFLDVNDTLTQKLKKARRSLLKATQGECPHLKIGLQLKSKA